MILVAGATGILGSEVCRRLRGRGVPVRALVRQRSDTRRVSELVGLGAEPFEADLKVPASLAAACAGADVVISAASGLFTASAEDSLDAVDRDGQIALANAARAAGARHMVTISSSGAISEDAPLIAAKRAVERHLAAIGLPHTNLRGSFFMDFWLGPGSGFDLAAGSVRVLGTGAQPTTWIAREDVAEFAVLAALEASAQSATIELAGPQALSQLDVVRMAEDIGGRAIEVTHVADEQLQAMRAGAVTPFDKTVAELMAHVAGGDVVVMTGALERFPVTRTHVRDHVRRTLSALSGVR